MCCGMELFVMWLCILGVWLLWRDVFCWGGSCGVVFFVVDWRFVLFWVFLGKVCDVYWEFCFCWFFLGWGRVLMDGGGGGSGFCLFLGGGGGKLFCWGKFWIDGGIGGRGLFLFCGGGGGSLFLDGWWCLGDEICDCVWEGVCVEVLWGRVLEGGCLFLLGNGGGVLFIVRVVIV